MERTIEDVEQELKTEHGLYLRALADFDNYRRRMDRERSHIGRETLREFILSLLDVVDDLERHTWHHHHYQKQGSKNFGMGSAGIDGHQHGAILFADDDRGYLHFQYPHWQQPFYINQK